tara:strand:+ start:97 stop:846 length:750 start_codon:yes stop_codon:yes gene_type:complete
MIDFNILKELDSEIKISLEDEGLTFDQAVQITCNAHMNNVNVTMKIGGAEAISDMRFAYNIGCNGCVAPMIESKYALHKFISSIHRFNFDFDKLYINIETKQAYENIESILNSMDVNYLDGIVLGRSDFIQSFNKPKNKVDSNECLEMAKDIFKLAKSKNLKTLMGGNINTNSIDFIKKLYGEDLLDYIETRNVKVKLSDKFLSNYHKNISKMLDFEVSFLKSKYKTLDILSELDKKRKDNLQTRGSKV